MDLRLFKTSVIKSKKDRIRRLKAKSISPKILKLGKTKNRKYRYQPQLIRITSGLLPSGLKSGKKLFSFPT